MAMFGTAIQGVRTLFLLVFVDFELLFLTAPFDPPWGFGFILSMRFKTSSRDGESGSPFAGGLRFVIPATCFFMFFRGASSPYHLRRITKNPHTGRASGGSG
jgi:hypothetical protein